MVQSALPRARGGQDLTDDQVRWVVGEIMTGAATSAQIAAIAVALRGKGESPTKVRAFADALLDRSAPVPVDGKALDIVGTGGDQARTVNVSTMAAITAAACGRLVVKHGSRAASSACGTADVLEHLGVAVELDAQGVAEVARRAGISFCFAARFHRPLAHAAPARREIAIPTIFAGTAAMAVFLVLSAVRALTVRRAAARSAQPATRGPSSVSR